MRQLRLLNILTVRFGANGITVFVMNYYRHIDRAAVCADFIVPNPVPARVQAEVTKNGGHIYVLPQRNRNPFSYRGAVKKIVSDNHYDIVHAHGNSATLAIDLLAARDGGAPVRIAHSHNTSCKMKLADRLLRPAFYGSFTHAMACGREAGEWLFGSRPFTVVQNAIDTALFSFHAEDRARVRAELGLDKDAFVLCHVGTFNAQKNHSFLIRVFARVAKRLPNARLLLIGDGALRDAIELDAYKRKLTDKVISIGAVPSTASYLAAADAFTLPSLHEGLPFTLIEAQASGLPCFVSDVITPDAFFGDLVTPLPLSASPDAWADAICSSYGAPDGEAARASASHAATARILERGYDIERNAVELLKLYRAYTGEPE